MSNTFQILSGFLERFGDEVEGRELAEPSTEVQTKIREFARGKLRGAEQGEMIKLLNENPVWIGRLAEEIKGLREGPTK